MSENVILDVSLRRLIIVAIILALLYTGKTIQSDLKCQWKPFRTATQLQCYTRCPSYYGFLEPISNKLICFHRSVISAPIEETNQRCECGYVAERVFPLRCEPRKTLEFGTIYNGKNCKKICDTIHVYLYRHKNKVWVSHCEENPSFFPEQLDVVDFYRDGGKYICQCGMISERIKRSETDEEATAANRITQNKPWLSSCPMEPFIVLQMDRCRSTCFEAKAYFLPNSGELIYYHTEKKTKMISLSENDCECGVMFLSGYRLHPIPCSPKKRLSAFNAKDCTNICESRKAYIFNILPKMFVNWCEIEEYSPSQVYVELDWKIQGKNVVLRKNGSRFIEYLCTCGISSLSETADLDSNKNKASSSSRVECNNSSAGEFQSNDDQLDTIFEDNTFIDSLEYPSPLKLPEVELIEAVDGGNNPLSVGDRDISTRNYQYRNQTIDSLQQDYQYQTQLQGSSQDYQKQTQTLGISQDHHYQTQAIGSSRNNSNINVIRNESFNHTDVTFGQVPHNRGKSVDMNFQNFSDHHISSRIGNNYLLEELLRGNQLSLMTRVHSYPDNYHFILPESRSIPANNYDYNNDVIPVRDVITPSCVQQQHPSSHLSLHFPIQGETIANENVNLPSRISQMTGFGSSSNSYLSDFNKECSLNYSNAESFNHIETLDSNRNKFEPGNKRMRKK